MNSELSIVTQYARALYKAACNKNKLDVIRSQLITLNDLIKNYPQQFMRLSAAISTYGARKNIFTQLSKLYSFDPLTLNFLLTLSFHNRLSKLGQIIDNFTTYDNNQKKILSGRIISANPIDQAQKKEINSRLKTQLNQTIQLDYQVDPDILGGMIIQIGMLQIDNSMRNKLQRFKLNTQTLY